MLYLLKKVYQRFREIIVDDERRLHIQFVAIYVMLCVVSLAMSIVNVFTRKWLLMCATLSFAVLCGVNILLSSFGKKPERVASGLFEVEVLVLFSFFIVSGTPEGFSAIWCALLPITALLLFKSRNGSVLSGAMFLLLIFFFWTPWGRSTLHYEYTQSFMLRFPMLYLAFYLVALVLETVRSTTFDRYHYQFTHDVLTDAMNRTGFAEVVNSSLREEHFENMGFVIFDLDDFKKVNDTYGHFTGDQVLIQAEQCIQRASGLLLCRWGGEEFAAFDREGALTQDRLDRIVQAVAENRVLVDGLQIPVTVSAGGVIMRRTPDITPEIVEKEADLCLYTAKANGKNRAVFRDLSRSVAGKIM